MKLQYAFCAKYADANPDGSFSVIGGGIDKIRLTKAPGGLPLITLVIHVAFDKGEDSSGQTLQVHLYGPDGQLLPFDVNIAMPAKPTGIPEDPEGFSLTALVAMVNPPLNNPGVYKFKVFTKKEELGSVSLFAAEAQGEGMVIA